MVEKMKTVKALNYTPEMVKDLLATYVPTDPEDERNAQVASLAVKYDKKKSSIRGKLNTLGVYVGMAKIVKNGPLETKGRIVNDMADMLSCPAEVLDSVTKATKPALVRIREYMRKGQDAMQDIETYGLNMPEVGETTTEQPEKVASLLNLW